MVSDQLVSCSAKGDVTKQSFAQCSPQMRAAKNSIKGKCGKLQKTERKALAFRMWKVHSCLPIKNVQAAGYYVRI